MSQSHHQSQFSELKRFKETFMNVGIKKKKTPPELGLEGQIQV